MKRLLQVLVVLFAFVAVPATAQTFPPLNGQRVVDQANLLSPAQEADLTNKSATLEAQTKRQFVVATVNSLEGRPIEDYAYRLGRAWQIGQKDKDDGVILLVAPNEREVWIATGYGAGEFLTDVMSGVIIREAIIPQFKKGDYGAGITAGADAIIKQMSLPADQARANVEKAQQQQSKRRSGGSALPAFFWIMIAAFVLLSMFRRAGGKRYRSRHRSGISPWVVLWGLNELSRGSRGSGWSGGGWGGGGSWGGGGGGGFGGFSGGGGSFGGGGAGGSW